MGKDIKQAKWDCTTEGKLTGMFPGGVSVSLDLTKVFPNWADFSEAEMFFAGYGVKQKCMDYSSDPKWTYQEKADRAKTLYGYAVKHGKLPETKRSGGFGISKKAIAEKIEARDKPLTKAQTDVLREFGLID